jgi:RHS repeat-associated protein
MKSGGNVLSLTAKTDYYPFGMPMPNKHTTDGNYRYAFQGQEKDSETGMEAFELRLWDGRIGRWLTIDPYHEFFSPYLGMGNNPINLIDPDGGMTDPPKTGKVGEKYNDADYGMLTYDGNFWLDSNGEAILNGVTMVGVKSTGLSFFDDGSRSRLQLPGEYMPSGNLSKYLSLEDVIRSETATRLKVSNMPSPEHIENLKAFGRIIYDPIYENFNGNIKISSGYRSSQLNLAVGGSKKSQHLTGEALDIQGTNGVTNSDIFYFTKKNLNYHQLIWEYGTKGNPRWVHVGYRVKGNNKNQTFSIPKNLKTNF